MQITKLIIIVTRYIILFAVNKHMKVLKYTKQVKYTIGVGKEAKLGSKN